MVIQPPYQRRTVADLRVKRLLRKLSGMEVCGNPDPADAPDERSGVQSALTLVEAGTELLVRRLRKRQL